MNYYNHYEMGVEGTYIISILGNKVSEKLTKQCYESCQKVGQPNVQIFPAFDATNSKYLVILRDLRDVICSLDSLQWKHPHVFFGDREQSLHQYSLDHRMAKHCTDKSGGLGRPLNSLPHVVEVAHHNPSSFYFLRQEDFNEKPKETLQQIYEWLGEPNFEHDFDNISKSDYYEHDTVYRSLVSHKTRTKLEKLEPRWPKVMTEEQSKAVIHNNRWYYETFYPEAL